MTKQCLSAAYLQKCGTQTGFHEESGGSLVLTKEWEAGIFISRIYDSGRKQTEWNRIVLDIDSNAVIQVYVWLFDEQKEGRAVDKQGGIREQLAYLKTRAQYSSNYREMLLYGRLQGRGRFARLAVEILRGDRTGNVRFNSYGISFPKESFTSYLPAIYRDNLQLERFLSVHQSIYLELEQQIDNLATQLDYEHCSAKQVKCLADWMGWGELAGQVDEETLRKLLKEGISLANRKGTCEYYKRMAEILTGRQAVLLEEPEKHKAILLIKCRPEEGRERYLEWLRKNVPIGIRMDFVILHRTDRLDGQYFLDVTAHLSRYESELSGNGVDIDSLRLL